MKTFIIGTLSLLLAFTLIGCSEDDDKSQLQPTEMSYVQEMLLPFQLFRQHLVISSTELHIHGNWIMKLFWTTMLFMTMTKAIPPVR